MGGIQINKELCNHCGACVKSCAFGALEYQGEEIQVNAACKLCKICIKTCLTQAITLTREPVKQFNKHRWSGILVYAEHNEGVIHPVTYELIGKAKELAAVTGQMVFCVIIGERVEQSAQSLLYYGIEKVFVYDSSELHFFRVDVYANAMEDCILNLRPSVVLVGATSVGRSLAPRVATRFSAGLTADCTALQMRENSDLVQIRPAFGGNVMAQILTANSRPQFATVRYKVMDPVLPATFKKGILQKMCLPQQKLHSEILIHHVERLEHKRSIMDAEILVVAGRGLRCKGDLQMLQELADLLGGEIAATRPLIEWGWLHYSRQIGLSGRTVKPKLIITCGVSGAIQFTAGMNGADYIIAINSDENAPMISAAHFGLVGDLYEIIPRLISRVKGGERYAV